MIHETGLERWRRLFDENITCPICRQQKFHSRREGYRCSNSEHQELENNLIMKAIERREILLSFNDDIRRGNRVGRHSYGYHYDEENTYPKS